MLLTGLALAVCAVLFLVGCGGKEDDTTEPQSSASSEPSSEAIEAKAKELVVQAMGTGIATQDFHLVFDIERVDADGIAVSVYDDVLEQALVGIGDRIETSDGSLTVATTDSLTGRIVDARGETVPGVEIGFAVLEISPSASTEFFDPDGSYGLTSADLQEKPTLVVFSTSDLSETATLIAPGDQFELDLTFVEELQPGDTVRHTVAFGQTIVMRDEAFETLSAGETFTTRFAAGQIAMLAGSEDPGEPSLLVATTESVAIQGSTLTRNQIKVIKYIPTALGASAVTVLRCYVAFKGTKNPFGSTLKCAHTARTVVDNVKRDGQNASRRNRNLPPCPPLRKCGRAGGDVHMRTFDGRSYDLQSVGEFNVALSDVGHVVQLRLSPWATSDRVSVVTGAAMRIAGAEVSFQIIDGVERVHIDGEAVSLVRGSFTAVGEGGVLIDTGDTVIAVWPDGSQLNMRRDLPSRYDVVFSPAPGDAVWRGLMGSRDDDQSNDLVLADGSLLEEVTPAAIHGPLADAWRVTDDESLFVYGEGESTATFTDRDFPAVFTSLADLDVDARSEAETMCREYGITDQDTLDDCTLDVALTGDTGFIVSAGMLEDAVSVEESAPTVPGAVAPGTELKTGPATLTTVPTASAGSDVTVSWTGPANRGDYISIALAQQTPAQYETYKYVTAESDTVVLTAPGIPGEYVVRYVLANGKEVLAAAPLDVAAVEATLNAPESVPAGGPIEVRWTGPGERQDYISISKEGFPAGRYEGYQYVKADSDTVVLTAPGIPGTYELRYVLSADRQILATAEIVVEPVTAELEVPERVGAGTQFMVLWTGPAFGSDYVSIAEVDQPAERYRGYAYARPGETEVELTAPAEAGEYEIRYVLYSDRQIVARKTVMVEAATAALQVPERVEAGAKFTVSWTGPAARSDFISIAAPDAPGSRYESYVYARTGESEIELTAPTEPGTYEVRYVLYSGRAIVTAQTIVVE